MADPDDTIEETAPEGAWPSGMPYTVHFPDGEGYIGADLEHPAPLPRVGDLVEYLDETGATRRFRVHEVVHTLQSSAAHRPRVEDEGASPDSIARVDGEPPERPGESGVLRAGLPKVILEPAEEEAR
ncbi:MAG TPA: hypothetical protein VH859_02895 [Candidatus Limnocylindria bacterium]|jgi:hypothetical protein